MRALLTVAVYITPFLLIGVAAKSWMKRTARPVRARRPIGGRGEPSDLKARLNAPIEQVQYVVIRPADAR
jgi:hypothetical protein